MGEQLCVQTSCKLVSPEVNWTIKDVLILQHVTVSVQTGSLGRGNICVRSGKMPTGTPRDVNVSAVLLPVELTHILAKVDIQTKIVTFCTTIKLNPF